MAAAGALVLLFAQPALASAADRFAEPLGNGAEPCLAADPCGIENAVEGAPAQSTVKLASGTYSLSDELLVTSNVAISGDPNGSATISSTAPVAVHVAFSSANSELDDFVIDHDPASGSPTIGLQLENGTARRLSVDSTGNYACFVQGFLADSFCHMTAASSGIAAGLFSPGTADGVLTNVTAVADGTNSYGLAVASTSGTGDVELVGHNVIAQGDADTGGFGNTGVSHLELDSSDFSTYNFANPGTATGTLATENNNISDEPMLEADSLHETPSSPTIDAGQDAFAQLFDIDGDERLQGNAVDIGADEADGVAPATKITKKPPRKTKSKTGKFKFSSTEPGSTFKCKLDSKPFSSCTSGKKYKHLKPGKHKFQVRATDDFGNTDPTPSSYSWTVKKPKRHHH